MKCAKLYVQDWSMTKIEKELEIHREQVKGNIKKVLNAFLKREQIQIVNNPKQVPLEEFKTKGKVC